MRYPVNPDGRYFVVRGRLWRMADPALPDERRQELVRALMSARRTVAAAKRADDPEALAAARALVDIAKRELGERGPVWWIDETPDLNRRLVRASPYEAWHTALSSSELPLRGRPG